MRAPRIFTRPQITSYVEGVALSASAVAQSACPTRIRSTRGGTKARRHASHNLKLGHQVSTHLFELIVRAVEIVHTYRADLDGFSKGLANLFPGRFSDNTNPRENCGAHTLSQKVACVG